MMMTTTRERIRNPKSMVKNNAIIQARRKENRIKIIEYLGGKCTECGTTDKLNIARKSVSDSPSMSSMIGNSWETLRGRLCNFHLLCDVHFAQSNPQHGCAKLAYKNKCECDQCEAYRVQYRKRAAEHARKPGGIIDLYAERRKNLIELLNGHCVECGSTENLRITKLEHAPPGLRSASAIRCPKEKQVELAQYFTLHCQHHHAMFVWALRRYNVALREYESQKTQEA